MASYKVGDLPPQVLAKIRPSDLAALGVRVPVTAAVTVAMNPKKTMTKREPNKTELRYRREVIDRDPTVDSCVYEGLVFRLANGHRYTPDWIVIRRDGITAIEVKGSYRLHSHGRARLAFDQARTEWPSISFIWATLTNEGWAQ